MAFARRRFLQLLAGSLLGLRPRRARASDPGALFADVHRATRNTRFGAIGRRLWPSGQRPARAKAYVGRSRIALPPPGGKGGPTLDALVRELAGAESVAAAPLPLEALSRLLHLTNGVTAPGPRPLRAAPSAGALYSGEVYVVAEQVPGLEAGLYSYHAPTHQLVSLRSGSQRAAVAACVERPQTIVDASAFVLLTNVFARYTHRYANRGYRYALIDSGHIGENLRLAAASQGLGVATPLRFHDDALNALLEVDGRQEAVCALHALGKGRGAADEPVQGLVEAQRAPDFRAEAAVSRPERYHAATKLVPGDRAAQAPAVVPAARAAPVLPLRAPAAATLAWAIEERRSADRFLEQPIALEDLSYLLDLARRSDAARLAPGIELRLVVHRVAGLAPGLYRYDPATHALPAVQRVDLVSSLHAACGGQDKAASAAVGFAMVGDLEGAAARGDRGYRDLLIEAGAVGQRLYLAAEAIGLAARNLAAFFDDGLNELLRVDGARRAVVHLTMVGPGN